MAKNRFGSRTSADTVLAGLNLKNKYIVITGSNTGIGYETARALAAADATVVIACRNSTKGNAAVQKITGAYPGSKVSFMPLDLASMKSIQAFAQDYPHERIDVLIANAGVVPTHYQETEEGVEQCVGVCHFGHFALTRLMMPALLRSEAPRVVMVSSESHRSPRHMNFSKFPLNKDNFATFVAYGQAKLCNVLFANELQRRYGDQGLSACSLHPGALITTDIGRNSKLFSVLMVLISPFTKNPNQGASTTVYCAAYADAVDIQGQYFSHCKKARASKEAQNPEVAAKLWQISEEFCEQHGIALS